MSFNRSNIGLRSGRHDKARGGALSILSSAFLTLGWVILYTYSINAQQSRTAPQAERPAAQSLTSDPGNASVLSASEDYRISAGDVIQIQIEDAPELSHFYRVGSSGRIEMPVLGMVEAQKHTTFELARLIAKELREKEYLNTPNVLVTINQYYSQTFFIQGSVRNPGVYQMEGRPSLLTMIGLAGGLAGEHGSTAFILRPDKNQKAGPTPDSKISNIKDQASGQSRTEGPDSLKTTEYELIKINIGALYKGQFDQRLEPGDIVNIPRADVFFVAGEVRAPGSFPLKEGTTVRQAISLAQGMTFNAKAGQGVIFREDSVRGSRQEIKVDIGDVMNGKKEDIPVQANDVIIIPNSRTKSIGGALLMAFGINATRFPVR